MQHKYPQRVIGVDGTVFLGNLTGVGQYSLNLLKRVAALMPNNEFVVFSPNVTGQGKDLLAKFGEPNIRIKLISDWPRRNGIFWSLFGQALAALPERLDIFWATNGLVPIFMPCPVCLTIYDFVYRIEPETMKWRARLWRSFSQPRWIKKSSKIFSISDDVAAQTLKYYGRNVDAVIKPAADSLFSRRSTPEIEIVRGKYGIESHYGLIVGTLEPRKNVRLFVETYLDFRAGHVTDTVMPQLVVIGGKGWNDKDILRVLGSAEASGSVRRLGYVDQEDLPALYSGADVFYMPSRYEGFGMPILEARKCGTHVVCSDVPAMREAGGKFALYHPPTRDGIWEALEQVHVRCSLPDSDFGQAVDWSWESGAQQLKTLLRSSPQKR